LNLYRQPPKLECCQVTPRPVLVSDNVVGGI
jgi:hypothetical protein